MLFEFPGYQILEKLSENNVFKIFRCQRSQDNSPVLLKVLNQPYPTPKYLAPLWQEFEILRGLDLSGVEKAYALENHQPWWMIVLEDFGGRPLDQLEIGGSLEPEEFLNLAFQLVEIVGEIHAHQVIHKNIAPANISYNLSTGQAKLTNFGYASLVSKEKAPLQNPFKLAEFLAYISPEMTGRMNRSVDYRTDYYSLGAALYELLTGTPPFPGETPLELVHAHLAILPDPPVSRMEPWSASPTAFQILSAILLKLLSKNPEDRYQTPGALRADLDECLSALKEPPTKGPERPVFVPGQVDRTVDLHIPQMVVGREDEAETLLQAFLRTTAGPMELVLVSGEAGVGKTTLVNQLVGTVIEHKGLFLYTKYDQVRRQAVYQALITLLEEFCWLVLSEPIPSFREWRERVQAAVAPHGQLLTSLCPQLEKVIGPQPPVEPVDEELARPRLYQVVIRFLQTVCQPDHPVVIFLDDLQWINPDSLLLWQSVLSTPSIQNLLVVGAYRDNEVGPEHPIHRWVEEVQTIQKPITQLQLKNLEWPVIHRLVAAALASDPAEISELTTLVYLRTEGNPYFSNEFLKSLNKDQLLAFDLSEQKWRWDANRIEAYGVASNVVDLFVHEIANLDADTQKTLQYAALIGRRFDTATLLALFGTDKANLLAESLWEAMTEGLIQPLDENYRFLASENSGSFNVESGESLPSLANLLEEQILFEFQHDRVQQAAMDMLDEQNLAVTSLQMGWLLLEKAESAGQEAVQEAIFTIADHLNRGSALIEDPVEAIKTAQLNLMASNQARLVAAFEAASGYLSAGIQLLPKDSWQDQYALTLELFAAGAEVALLTGDLERAETLALEAEANAHTLLEKARIIKIRMDLYLIQTQLDQVIELGIAAIQMFEFDLEAIDLPAFNGEEFLQLPEMKEPGALAVSRLVEPLFSAAFARNDPRFAQIIFFFIGLFIRFGNPPGASYVYIVYAIILLKQFEQMEQGCRMGRMALVLAEEEGPSKTLYAVRFVYYAFVHHWSDPASEGLKPLYENIQPAFEAGNLRFSINSQDLGAQNSLLVGIKLEQVWSKQVEALRQIELLKQAGYTQRLRIWAQAALKLIGEPLLSQEITGDLFSEDEAQKLKEAGINQNYIFNLYVAQAFLSLFFREPQRAVDSAASAVALKQSGNPQLIYAHFHFIHSLALLSAGLDAGDLVARIETVGENLRLMRLWAERVPENYLHQVELVEAELARCLGRVEEAAEGYEQAIKNARKNGYIHESALAAELAAEFYLAQEEYAAAKDHLFTAYASYLAWGAKAKVGDLENRYPDWLPPGRGDGKKAPIYPAAEDRPVDEIASSIDLSTILRASLELAQETSLEELLRKLMSILIENAGAQSGSLIIFLDDRWFLEVQGSTDPAMEFALLSIPLDEQGDQIGEPLVPTSIIHYVMNAQASLVLEDASVSYQFSQDAYLQSRRPKSVLCAPLMNQGVLSGVVYLENNLAAGAFTPERLQIVQLISSQAAVSIEKARLYENLEGLVEERTRELSEANRKLKEEIDERIRVEEALRLSEERYRRVFENTGTAMALIGPDGTIVLTNGEFVRLTGYSKEMLENHFDSLDLVAPVDRSRIRLYRLTRLANPSGVPNSFEFQLVDRNGIEKAVLNTATLVPGSKSIIISLIDISQRKQAELELQIAIQELTNTEEELRTQNEELSTTLIDLGNAHSMIEAERQRYLDLYNFAPDAYFVTNDKGKIIEANRAAESLLGSKNKNLAGKLLISFLSLENRRVFRTRLAEMASQQEASDGWRGYRDWEVHMHQRDGSPFDASITVAVVSGNQGEPTSLRWLVRDISAHKKAQRALRESEERLRSITENAPDFIAELDLQGRILYANRAPAGFQLEDLVGASLFDFIPEEYRSEVEDLLENVYQGGEMMQAEFKGVFTQGMERWQSVHLAPVSGPGGIDHFVLISTDITAQKWIEEQLRAAEEFTRATLNSLSENIAILDEDGLILWVNRAWQNFALDNQGDPAKTGVGVNYLAVCDQAVGQEAEMGGKFAEGIRATLRGEVETFEIEYECCSAEEIRWFIGRVTTFSLGDSKRVVVAHDDITQIKQYELALQKSEALYRAVVNTQTEVVCRFLPDTTLTFVNEAYCRFVGKTAGELIGQSFLTTLPDEYHETIQDIVRGMLDHPDILENELPIVYSSGEKRWQQWVNMPIFEQGKVVEFQAVGFDITGRKQAEEALRASEEKFRMLFENSPDAVFLTNPNGPIVAANPAACAMFGWSEQEFTHLSRSDVLDGNDPRLTAALEERKRKGRIQSWELTAIRKSGERFPAEVDSVVLPEEHPRSFVILRDITERKIAEEARRYNEALLKKVLEILPVGVWILDENGKITSGNPEGQRIWSGAKYLGLQEFGEYKAWRAETGEPVRSEEWSGGLAVTQGQITLNEELEIEAFDGTRRTILNFALPLMIEKNQLAGAIVVNQDITRRKRDEKELKAAHDQLSTLLQISQSIVSTLDIDPLLNLIIEQLGAVMPYEGAAILILDQDYLEFRVIRGPAILHKLSKYQIPVHEPTLIEPLIKDRQSFYLPDLQAEEDLLFKIQNTIRVPSTDFAFLRSWLGIPLIARDELVGILVLTHSQADHYSRQSIDLAQVFANQVAIAIQNAQLYKRAQDVATLEERNRLSRELHDSVAQALYSISLFTDATQMALETNRLEVVKNHLGELDQLSREALADMRLMIFELRPPVLEQEGLVSALQSRIDSVEARAGIEAKFYTEGEPDLSTEEEGELYRIAQEALNNVIKHAQAKQVRVQLTGEAGYVRLVIEDDGIGFDPVDAEQEGGQGIRNIRERAEKIGAACWIVSAPGQGTKITVEVRK